MIEVFRYSVSGIMNDERIVSPCMATRAFIETSGGEIIKGSHRHVDARLLPAGDKVVQGFTGEQVSYLRELVSLGPLAISSDTRSRSWLKQLISSRLVCSSAAGSGIRYAITPLGRVAVEQLL